MPLVSFLSSHLACPRNSRSKLYSSTPVKYFEILAMKNECLRKKVQLPVYDTQISNLGLVLSSLSSAFSLVLCFVHIRDDFVTNLLERFYSR